MKIEISDKDVEIIKRAEKIVGYGDRNGNYIPLEDLIGIIECLIYEVDRIEEEKEDTEKYYQDNFEPISPNRMYGISESDFH